MARAATFVPEWQRLDLYELMASIGQLLKPNSYLEVGVDTGESVKALLMGQPDLSELILCDPWLRQPHHSHVHIEELLAGYEGEITYLDGRSQDLLPAFLKGRQVDLAFIDGEHTYAAAKTDIANIWPKTNLGIVVHDMDNPEVWRAFYEFCRDTKPRLSWCSFAGHGAGLAWR